MGAEFDWLLQDQEGHVALCQTSGFGDIPRSILVRGRAAVEADDARLESLACALPVTGGYRPWWSRTAKDPLSRELAMRGFHVYVWGGYRGPYWRKLRPEHPLHIAEIAASAPGLAETVPKIALLFRRARWIPLGRHLQCLRLHGGRHG